MCEYIHEVDIHNSDLWYINISWNPFSENQETAPKDSIHN